MALEPLNFQNPPLLTCRALLLSFANHLVLLYHLGDIKMFSVQVIKYIAMQPSWFIVNVSAVVRWLSRSCVAGMKIILPLCPQCLHSRLICWSPHWQQKGINDVLINNKLILHIFKV